MSNCNLMNLLNSLTTMRSSQGNYVVRNKLANALVFLLQQELEEDPTFKDTLMGKSPAKKEEDEMQIDTSSVVQEKPSTTKSSEIVAMVLMGTIRILSSLNKKFVVHLLKSLIYREEYFEKRGSSMLKIHQQLLKKASQTLNPPLIEVLKSMTTLRNKTSTMDS